jgi:hypothetical protein
MKRRRILCIGFAAALLVVMAGHVASAADGKVDPKAAFEKLKSLAGEWSGTAGEGFPAPVSYRVSANGNAVMETLFPGTSHEMITMYYLADNDLVATHYCAVGNQPHFRLDHAKSTPDELVFAFDGGTNFDPTKDGHIHEGRIAFTADGKLESSWAFYTGGKAADTKNFHLARAAK